MNSPPPPSAFALLASPIHVLHTQKGTLVNFNLRRIVALVPSIFKRSLWLRIPSQLTLNATVRRTLDGMHPEPCLWLYSCAPRWNWFHFVKSTVRTSRSYVAGRKFKADFNHARLITVSSKSQFHLNEVCLNSVNGVWKHVSSGECLGLLFCATETPRLASGVSSDCGYVIIWARPGWPVTLSFWAWEFFFLYSPGLRDSTPCKICKVYITKLIKSLVQTTMGQIHTIVTRTCDSDTDSQSVTCQWPCELAHDSEYVVFVPVGIFQHTVNRTLTYTAMQRDAKFV